MPRVLTDKDVAGGRYEVPAAPAAVATPSTEISQEYLALIIQRNTEVMERMLHEGVTAYYNKDFRDLKKMKDDMDKLTNSKLKAWQ